MDMGEPLIPNQFNLLNFKFIPSPSQKDLNLLILLHGLGDNEDIFFKLGKRLNLPQTAVVALQAPLALPHFEASYMWWNSFDFTTGDELKPTRDEESVRGCIRKLRSFLDYAISKKWRPEGLFLFGFSQGATAALEVALSYPTKLGGVIGICGLPISEDLIGFDKIEHELPILIVLGNTDPLLPLPSALSKVERMRSIFNERNWKAIEYKIINGKGHEMTHKQEEVQLWMEFWGRHLLLSHPELEAMADVYQVNLN